jgi:RNA polymerase sigma-70 factor, ECF subfamily
MTTVDHDVLARAQGGDERAFVDLTAPHRAALHAHCYRLLGSLYDADDALQETLLRAWRGIERFEPRAPLGAWLYRIATNVCLRALEQRKRHTDAAVDAHLEPYPEDLIDQLSSPDPGPDAVVEEKEAIGLAFVSAMQLLPAKQRAALVLCDVLGWSARETAGALDDSTAAVNSALQRARRRLEEERREGSLGRVHAPASPQVESAVMRRFVEAWDAVDIDGIVALLADDALLTMPPEEARLTGADAVGWFFATQPLEGRLDRIKFMSCRANGQPALAAFADEHGEGRFDAYGLMVFAIDGDRITGIVGFPKRPDLFTRFGLPVSI